jgi:tRNA(Ile)-lysidine synthase
MNRSACILSESYDFIRTYTGARYAELVTEEQGQLCICAAALRREHPAVQKELLRMLLFAAAGHRRDIAAVHVEELLALTELQSGRSISLPYGVCAFMEYDTLHLCRDADARGGELPAVLETAVTPDILRTIAEEGTRDGKAAWRGAPGTTGWHTLWRDAKGGCIRARAWRTDAPLEEITKKSYTKQFDYDKIKCGFVVRTRRKGDYIVLDAAGHRKKLSDYMVDQKLPARLRGSIPLLAQGSEVLWLAGGRIGATCRVTKDTTRILEIEYNGGLADGLHKAT